MAPILLMIMKKRDINYLSTNMDNGIKLIILDF